MITYQSENTKLPKLPRRAVSKWIKEVSEKYGKKVGEIGYLFCDDKKILETNRQFLNHDYYTDIITFDYSENGTVSGDILISLDTVKSNAEKYKIPFKQELFRVMIHGILHLCGQNDKTEVEAKQMQKMEDEALNIIHF